MVSLGELLKTLIDAQIDFVLIGGYASVVHGSTMVTRDLDICALVTPVQIEKPLTLKDDSPKARSNASLFVGRQNSKPISNCT